jgi:hypothetical protein
VVASTRRIGPAPTRKKPRPASQPEGVAKVAGSRGGGERAVSVNIPMPLATIPKTTK